MNRYNSRPSPLTTSIGIFSLLLLAIFFTELAVMELFSPLFTQLDLLSASLVDAAILVLFFSLPLWFFIISPLFGGKNPEVMKFRMTPAGLFITVLAGIFLVEFVVMMIVPVVIPRADTQTQKLADACLTILFSAAPLWWLLFRQEMRNRRVFLTNSFGTPLRLYALLLIIIFLADLLQDVIFTQIFHDVARISSKIVDSFLTTLLIAPLLWLLVARPLRRAARLEKARANAIHAQVVDALVAIDSQGMIDSFNPAAERTFGYSADEITGKTAAMLFNDGEQSLDKLLQSATAGSNNIDPRLFHEIIGKCRNGSTLTMTVSISKVLLEGKQEFLLIMRDISDQKEMESLLRESEERFRQIFEQSEDAIIFFKPGTCSIIDANTTAEKLFGYSKAEIRRAGLEVLCRPADRARLSNAISSITKDEMSSMDNFVASRKDSEEIIVSMRGKVMILQGVTIVHCTFRNITARVRIEEEAQNIQAKLIEANKMTSLGLLVSGVAHEINNPNNFIMANSQLLAMTWMDALKILREYYQENGEFIIGGIPFSELDAHSPQLFAGIVDGSRRINEIIDTLKSFVRRDRRIMAERVVDVNQVATSAVSILHHEISKYTENFHLDLAEDIPPIKGNNQQLGQVIINLLMNACQALPAKLSGIWLSTRYEAAAGQVTITVRDEGCGMSQDASNRIMEPFFTTKLDKGGTGLGLSICQSIVNEHHGSLDFVSGPGKGTTFIVKIPAENPAAKENFE